MEANSLILLALLGARLIIGIILILTTRQKERSDYENEDLREDTYYGIRYGIGYACFGLLIGLIIGVARRHSSLLLLLANGYDKKTSAEYAKAIDKSATITFWVALILMAFVTSWLFSFLTSAVALGM